MTVLVTGGNGFAGRWLVRALQESGQTVVAGAGPDGSAHAGAPKTDVETVPLNLLDVASVRRMALKPWDAVAHLAGMASGGQALDDPGAAWAVNAGGTARLLSELGRRKALGETDPLVLLVSTAEVYGPKQAPLVETDPVAPISPYGASKLGAEVAAAEVARRTGLRVVVARSFPHTGPGQDERFVAPAFARRLMIAKQAKARAVNVGNLEITREFLDVRDVARAYAALLTKGKAGETYNVASGKGVLLTELFEQIASLVGVQPIAEADPSLVRAHDIGYLVGDAAKLRRTTGWEPKIPLEQTLKELVNAQAV